MQLTRSHFIRVEEIQGSGTSLTSVIPAIFTANVENNIRRNLGYCVLVASMYNIILLIIPGATAQSRLGSIGRMQTYVNFSKQRGQYYDIYICILKNLWLTAPEGATLVN